jgi:hypothetical protein
MLFFGIPTALKLDAKYISRIEPQGRLCVVALFYYRLREKEKRWLVFKIRFTYLFNWLLAQRSRHDGFG